MLSNAIGLAGLLLSIFPLVASAVGTNRLRTAIETHSAALEFLQEDQLRRRYRRHVEDLSHELVARTAVSGGGTFGALMWIVTLLAVCLAFSFAWVRGATSVGSSDREAWRFLLGDAGSVSWIVLPGVVLIGGLNCFAASKIALSRALYLNALVPGTQAYKRLVGAAKVYSFIVALPLLAVPIAFALGVDAVRTTVEIGVADSFAGIEGFAAWTVVAGVFFLGCTVWAKYCFPLSAVLGEVALLRRAQIAVMKDHYLTSSYSKDPDCATAFVSANEAAPVDYLRPSVR